MAAIRKAIKGNNFAKCAVETALLDAWGKRVGLPVSELVGGRLRDRLPWRGRSPAAIRRSTSPKPR